MNWKKLPYWIKGGIIGAIISLIMQLLPLINVQLPEFLAIPFLILIYPIFVLGLAATNEAAIYLSIIAVVYFFLLGAIIGKIYGMLKGKFHKESKRK